MRLPWSKPKADQIELLEADPDLPQAPSVGVEDPQSAIQSPPRDATMPDRQRARRIQPLGREIGAIALPDVPKPASTVPGPPCAVFRGIHAPYIVQRHITQAAKGLAGGLAVPRTQRHRGEHTGAHRTEPGRRQDGQRSAQA
jgi:hypothetical protein